MTQPANDRRKQWPGNGVATSFNGPNAFAKSHLQVSLLEAGVLTVVNPADYNVTGLGRNNGTRVLMNVAPTVTQTVVILRTVPVAQTTDLTNEGKYLPETVENAFDYLVQIDQQNADGIARSVRINDAEVGSVNGELPLGGGPGSPIVKNATSDGFDWGDTTLTGDMLLRGNLAAPGGAAFVSYRRADGTGVDLQTNLREKLSASRTYYVRTDGNDVNTGLANTAGGAFLTIQHAIDVVLNGVDTNGRNVTISVANGTYAGGFVVNGPIPGGGTLYIVGNTTTPASVSITAVAKDAILANAGAQILVTGFKVSTTTSGNGVNSINGSSINLGVMDFGACVNSHVSVAAYGVVFMTGNYNITGGAESHLHAGSLGLITFGAINATLTGTPAFSAYFAGVAQGTIVATLANFIGAATGARYLSHNAGIIMAHPGYANPFPGSVPGWADTGGFYKAGVAQGIQVASERDSGAYIDYQVWNGAGSTYSTIIRLQTDPSGTGRGYMYFNGDDSYSSGRTSLGTATRVQANVGTNDGVTVNSSGTRIEASANGAAIGWLRRRGSDGAIFDFLRDNSFVGSITVTAAATQYNVASDERVKFDIQPAAYDPTWINRVAATLRTFRYNADPDNQVTGPIAQLLADVQPNAVSVGDANADAKPGDEGFKQWGVDNSKLVAELLLEVADLRRRLDALEG